MAASVLAPDPSREVVASATSGADGRYEIVGLTPGVYDLTTANGDSVVMVRTVRLAAGDRRRTDLSLPAGPLSLRGRVVHRDGRPARGFVFVRNDDADPEAGPSPAFASVGPDGGFVAGGLDAGPVSVRLVDGGFARGREGATTLPQEGDFVFVVDEGLLRVPGRVVSAEDRSPIAEAFWYAMSHEEPEHCVAHGRTDAEGRFDALLVPPRGGEFRGAFLRAAAPGYVPVHRSEPLPEGLVELPLERAGRIEGRVRDASTKEPVAGATVVVVAEDHRGWAHAITDAEGRWAAADQPAGEVLVLVRGGGWISAEPTEGLGAAVAKATARLVAGETTRHDLEVVRGPRLEGRVFDANGLPVVEGRVEAVVARDQTPALVREMLHLLDAGRRTFLGQGPQGPSVPARFRFELRHGLEVSATTDAEGRYVLDGLLPGVTYDVEPSDPESGENAPTRVLLERGENRSLDFRSSR